MPIESLAMFPEGSASAGTRSDRGTTFDVNDHPDSLAEDLVRIFGRRTVEALKSVVGLIAIIGSWIVSWLMLVFSSDVSTWTKV